MSRKPRRAMQPRSRYSAIGMAGMGGQPQYAPPAVPPPYQMPPLPPPEMGAMPGPPAPADTPLQYADPQMAEALRAFSNPTPQPNFLPPPDPMGQQFAPHGFLENWAQNTGGQNPFAALSQYQPRNFGEGLLQGLVGGVGGGLYNRGAQGVMQKRGAYDAQLAGTDAANQQRATQYTEAEKGRAGAIRDLLKHKAMRTIDIANPLPSKAKASNGMGAAIPGTGDPVGMAVQSGAFPPTALGTRMTQYNKPAWDYLAKVNNPDGSVGYDMTKATLDWQGVQRWLSSGNAPNQLRLRQAIDATKGMLGNIESYNEQLKTLVPRNQIGAFNRGSLALALNGAYGPQAGEVAKKMRDQMSLVSTEIAQVMSGGYSPLDKAISQSAAILNVNTPPGQIVATIANLRTDLMYRSNSINTAGPMSPSNNPLSGTEGGINVGGRNIPVTGGMGAGVYGNVGAQAPSPPAGMVRLYHPDGRPLNVPTRMIQQAINDGAKTEP